jgi:hypothetical protein
MFEMRSMVMGGGMGDCGECEVVVRGSKVRQVGIFGRFEDASGSAVDVRLADDALEKAGRGGRDARSLGECVTLGGGLLSRDRGPADRPLAFVGLALGPAPRDRPDSACFKREFDEIEHRRWPRGQSDGGEFRDKDGEAAMQGLILKDLKRTIDRRIARKLLRNRLYAVLRAGAGVAADAAPVAGEIFDAYELAQTVADFHEMHLESDAAIRFVQEGTHELDALRASPENEGFSSSAAFAKEDIEKKFGPAGDGYDYHHIVEQGGPNETNIAPEVLHSTENMIKIPKILHEEITAIYSKRAPYTEGLSLRRWLSTKPYEFQRERGLAIMRKLGIIW